jgi:hypothetical protein
MLTFNKSIPPLLLDVKRSIVWRNDTRTVARTKTSHCELFMGGAPVSAETTVQAFAFKSSNKLLCQAYSGVA